ncbi:hypothetical protein TorRG33x02_149450, partial [Trema orientale]
HSSIPASRGVLNSHWVLILRSLYFSGRCHHRINALNPDGLFKEGLADAGLRKPSCDFEVAIDPASEVQIRELCRILEICHRLTTSSGYVSHYLSLEAIQVFP